MSALLRDVLVIPERAGAEDYVLRLTDRLRQEPLQARRRRVWLRIVFGRAAM